MKEAIRMVLESIYDPEFPDTSHFRSGRGCHSVLRRIKEEWRTSRWFLEFDIRNCFHTIDRHRLISIFKEEIDDPKFFYSIQKVFSAGRLVGGEKGPYSVLHSVLLKALLGNIYLHKLDQEIGRIRQKYEIPIVQRIRLVLLRTGRIDDQENSGEEASFNAPQGNRAIIVGSVKSIQRKAAFHSLVSSWHTSPTSAPRPRGDQKTPFVFPLRSASLPPSLTSPSSLLCAAFLIVIRLGPTPTAEFDGRERCNNNRAARDLFKYRVRMRPADASRCRRASHRNTKTYRPIPTIRPEPLGRLRRINNNSCAEYGRIPWYGHSGSSSEDDSHTILSRAGEASTADEGDERNRESTGRDSTSGDSWNSLRCKVPKSEQRAIGRSTGSLTIGHECPEVVIVYSRGSEGGGRRRRTLGGIYQQRIIYTDRGAYKKDTPKASGSRCCDNLYQVRTIVDYQIRWSAIFTLAHKHKSSARNIILKYSKDLNIVNKEGGKTLAEFPNSIELGKLGPGQDPNKNSHSTTSLTASRWPFPSWKRIEGGAGPSQLPDLNLPAAETLPGSGRATSAWTWKQATATLNQSMNEKKALTEGRSGDSTDKERKSSGRKGWFEDPLVKGKGRPDERSTELHPYSPGPCTSLSPGGAQPVAGVGGLAIESAATVVVSPFLVSAVGLEEEG
ncbi:unnamed protein product [Dovyalis caffra]|uniref:Maturase n=1 Tax=Dovyalis caffra TaxID=77055 RepID=A0AAV1R7Z1_9ROSI|nr:unnamed protein product [Dovyalis caffra]